VEQVAASGLGPEAGFVVAGCAVFFCSQWGWGNPTNSPQNMANAANGEASGGPFSNQLIVRNNVQLVEYLNRWKTYNGISISLLYFLNCTT
jgi:hypothetical protein